MSSKTSTQPGRRTPLSLTAAVSKGQLGKTSNNAANNNGNNANGHTTTNNNKQDNKLQQQKNEQQKSNNSDIKENPNNKKIQQQQSDKKQNQQQHQDNNKKTVEKNQNGLNNGKQQQSNENKQNQQTQNKESKQQNGSNKLIENDKKEKLEKQQDKSEKVEIKSKDDKKAEPEVQESNKKDEKKIKEIKEDTKEENMADKNETVDKVNEKIQNDSSEKPDDKKVEKAVEVAKQKLEEEKIKEKEIGEEQQQIQQKSPPVTPKANKTNKTLTPLNKTPTETTPQKNITLNSEIKTTPATKRKIITTTIDDVEMEPLTVESSPVKPRQSEEAANINIAPSATSTPGKILLSKQNLAAPKSDVQLAMQSGYSPERPRAFSQISGRRSIRPITDYTPSKFQSNPQFRESYRRINTELDITNTSMNVTVGSEVPNNLSFSFFGHRRKRDRTPPHQSAIGELLTDMEVSPPKKPRFEGFFRSVSSPLTLLRNRFSKTNLQSSTPVKLGEKLNADEYEIDVENVSGESIHEDLTTNEKQIEIDTTSNKDAILDDEVISNTADGEDLEDKDVFSKNEKACRLGKNNEQSDVNIRETPLQVAVDDPLGKNKRCIVM